MICCLENDYKSDELELSYQDQDRHAMTRQESVGVI